MMKKNIFTLKIFVITGLLFFSSCNDFLDEPTSKTTAIEVKTADQLNALLGNVDNFYQMMNKTTIYGTDDYELSLDLYNARPNNFSVTDAQYFTWDIDGVSLDSRRGNFWTSEYKKVFTANLVLNYLGKVSGSESLKKELEAESHLVRAYSYMELANIYCLPYTEANKNELGLPLKQSVNFEELSSRNTLEETYALIENDLNAATAITTPLLKGNRIRCWRGNTAAVNAITARYWLSRNNYEEALKAANNALSEYSTLVDYNTEMHYSEKQYTYIINKSTNEETVEVKYPYTYVNQTDISDMIGWKEFYYFRLVQHDSWWYIPSKELINLYKENPYDLRYKYHIIDGYSYDRGMTDPAYSYPGYIFFFKDRIPEGPTVAEMYLIKAECLARQDQVNNAMIALNTLRKARIDKDHYQDEAASNKEEAIEKILKERRREMPFSARWADIRRYNNNEDPNDDVELKRIFYPYSSAAILSSEAPKEYTLKKDSRRWAAPIPNTEPISSDGGIQQNTY